ncbi:MAG: helix-turn-helix domain-containing protein [Lachnospiraceae bacterium]|nr:helix-turn-helix domain-containing protein [Lachnospiraceae bacterium]
MDPIKSLAELRAERDMSQRDLAKEIGVSSAAIGMYESGKRTPPLKKAIMIAQLFNTQVENISFSDADCITK